jgi:hypothetical protein
LEVGGKITHEQYLLALTKNTDMGMTMNSVLDPTYYRGSFGGASASVRYLVQLYQKIIIKKAYLYVSVLLNCSRRRITTPILCWFPPPAPSAVLKILD